MVRNFGYVDLKDFDKASQTAKCEFAKIFRGTDYLQGGEPYYSRIVSLLSPKRGKRLVDLGYGRGFFLHEASKTGAKLYGVDFCSESMKIARKNVPSAELKVGDIHKIPFKSYYFDYVTCLGVIEHLVQPANGVKEIHRILKKDGIACITIPNSIYFYSRVWLSFSKYLAAKLLNIVGLRKKKAVFIRQPIDRFYTPQEGKKLLEKNGLKVYYSELLLSKRQNFKLFAKFPEGKISFKPSFFNANFTLYLCRKAQL